MSSNGIAIRVRDVSKHYFLYARPEDRLKQSIVPRLQRLAGREPAKYYRDFAALNSVSFEVRRGETVGIIGRNGSGKSTLLQIICGTLQPTSGSVEVNGRIAALLELGAGFNPDYTGRENVYLNAAILGLARSEIDARFEAIARFADIGQFIDQPVKTYSSGMYVRLAFATAINVDPDILVVDEALAVGDEAFQRKCFARIEEIQAKGGTILFVSHAAQTIVQLCSRALLIDGGELLLEGRPKMVTGHYQRLVNANASNAAQLKEQVRCDNVSMPPAPAQPASGEPTENVTSLTDASPLLDPLLIPQSTVSYGEEGCSIANCRLLTERGVPVNVLTKGRRYVYAYDVTFDTDATNVGFGMSIRTASGVEIAGATTRKSQSYLLREAPSGTRVGMQFRFECWLNAGIYFTNAGVRGTAGGDERYLHRIMDAVMFRVVDDGEPIAAGLVDLQIQPQVLDLSTPEVHAHG
jgi:lipopolysaccharide transport system ATP-binding protein